MQKIEWDYKVVVGKYNQNGVKHTISGYILPFSAIPYMMSTTIYNKHIHSCLAPGVFILHF